VAEFARRRLGAEAMEKLIEPMTAGVFAGNPDELSLAACFPRIHELESRYGGLIKAMLTLRWERRKAAAKDGMSAGPGGVLTSFDTGAQALVEVLAERLAGSLRLGCEAETLSFRGGKYRLAVRSAQGTEELEADAVVVSSPAFAASALLRGMDAELSAELGRIQYAPISVVALGYDSQALQNPLDGFGFLVPRLEGRRILGALWDSSVFPGRAPRGKSLIRAMVGGARQPDLAQLPEQDLGALVKEELRVCMGIHVEPELTRVFFYPRGIAQYHVGHGRMLERLAARLAAWPGLYLNSNAYRGVSLNDCARESRLTADLVLSRLG
jgi:oxygen-dependent protoporphyrinogen oxidase